jgi:hypothetical protein
MKKCDDTDGNRIPRPHRRIRFGMLIQILDQGC